MSDTAQRLQLLFLALSEHFFRCLIVVFHVHVSSSLHFFLVFSPPPAIKVIKELTSTTLSPSTRCVVLFPYPNYA